MRLTNTLIVIVLVMVGLGTLVVAYYVGHQKSKIVPLSLTPIQTPSLVPSISTPSPTPTVTSVIDDFKIEISSDKKSILNADTKEIVFTIEDVKKSLKNSGYKFWHNYSECFLDAKLSNSKQQIVFSTDCFPDFPDPMIGIYTFSEASNHNIDCIDKNCTDPAKIKFLTNGAGMNFVWSQDDQTITYQAIYDLYNYTPQQLEDDKNIVYKISPWLIKSTETIQTRILDSKSGEILEIDTELKNRENYNDRVLKMPESIVRVENDKINNYRCIEGKTESGGITPSSMRYTTCSRILLKDRYEIYKIKVAIGGYGGPEGVQTTYNVIKENSDKTFTVAQFEGGSDGIISSFRFK